MGPCLPPLYLPMHTVQYVAKWQPNAFREDPAVDTCTLGGGKIPLVPAVQHATSTWPKVIPVEHFRRYVHIQARIGKGKGGDTWVATLPCMSAEDPSAVFTVIVKRPKAMFPHGAPDTFPMHVAYKHLVPTTAITVQTVVSATATAIATGNRQDDTPHVGPHHSKRGSSIGVLTDNQKRPQPTEAMLRVNPAHNGYREGVLGRLLTTIGGMGVTPHIGAVYRVVPSDIPYVLHTIMEPASVTLHAFLQQAVAQPGNPGPPVDMWIRVALVQVFQGLLAAHCALGFRHNDLHVENVLLQQLPRRRPTHFRYVLDVEEHGAAAGAGQPAPESKSAASCPKLALVVPTLGMCWKIIDFQWGSSDKLFDSPGVSDHDVLMGMRQAAHNNDHTRKRCTCRHPKRPYAFSQAAFDAELLIQNVFAVVGTGTPELKALHGGLISELQRVHKDQGIMPSAGTPVAADADPSLALKVYKALIVHLAEPLLHALPGPAPDATVPTFYTCQPGPGVPRDLLHPVYDEILVGALAGRGDAVFHKMQLAC